EDANLITLYYGLMTSLLYWLALNPNHRQQGQQLEQAQQLGQQQQGGQQQGQQQWWWWLLEQVHLPNYQLPNQLMSEHQTCRLRYLHYWCQLCQPTLFLLTQAWLPNQRLQVLPQAAHSGPNHHHLLQVAQPKDMWLLQQQLPQQ
ncbi:hypothetical protein, partial [Salmonella sp. s51933]|uniref:hypothetical protein n=1 Tax=Salmonella sp. s51933 TaxID=3160127 RepID=UPI00375500D1